MENTKNFIEDKGHENWSRKIILTQLADEGTQKYISLSLTLNISGGFFLAFKTLLHLLVCVCVCICTLSHQCVCGGQR